MLYRRFVLTLFLTQQAIAAPQVPFETLAQEVAESNYFSDGPATFASLCVGEECQSVVSGHTRVDRKEPVSLQNLLTIGSNSKYITAVLTLILVDQGYLKLEDKLADFFPEYSNWQGVTIRDLLNHSSGIPPYLFSEEGINRVLKSLLNWHTRRWKPYELVKSVIDKPQIFPAGTKVEYNNTNYVLLGMIAEKVTQVPLAELLSRNIFAPLGMKDTYLELRGSEKIRRVAGYLRSDLPVPNWLVNILSTKIKKVGPYLDTTNIFDSTFVWAAGGMVSNTRDLAKMTQALFHGKLISPALLEQMKTTRPGQIFNNRINYGLGLMQMPTPFGEAYGHGGLTPGYQVVTNYIKDHDMVLSVAQNMGPSQLYSVYYDLLDRLFNSKDQKPFFEDPAVNAKIFKDNGVHLRLKGKVTASAEPSGVFPQSIGYAQVKGGAGSEQPFMGFHTYSLVKDERTFLVINAKGGKGMFDIAAKADGTFSFMDILIDRDKILADDSRVFKSQGDDIIFAYKGLYRIGPDGVKKSCIAEVIDEEKLVSFQIEYNKGQSFRVNESIKFAGNIPLKKIDSEEIPKQIEDLKIPVCGKNGIESWASPS